jgi:hypothetical protein
MYALRTRAIHRQGRWPAAIGHLFLALAVLAGFGHSGARYYYCEALGLSTSDPCARAVHKENCPVDVLADRKVDCCEVIVLPAMPEGARAASPSVPPSPQLAVLSASWFAEERIARGVLGWERIRPRWRPPPRSPSELRAELMVFLA